MNCDNCEKRERLIASRNLAFQNRTFEIELYWKRTAYFMTAAGFIVAGIVEFITQDKVKPLIITALSLLLFIISFLWLRLNHGSKYWQKHWEDVVKKIEKAIETVDGGSTNRNHTVKGYIELSPDNFYTASLTEHRKRPSVSKINNMLCYLFLLSSSILFIYYGNTCITFPLLCVLCTILIFIFVAIFFLTRTNSK